MTIGRTLLRYCTLIYALFLSLFSCLITSWKKLKIWRGLGPRIGDRWADTVGEGFAYSVIEQVLSTVIGQEGYVERMPERVGRPALVEVLLSLSRHFGVLPGRHLVNISLSCLSSQLLRRRTSGKQVTPRFSPPHASDSSENFSWCFGLSQKQS